MSDYDVDRRKHLIFNQLLSTVSISGKRILEVGSGTGRFSRELQNRGARLTILDIGHGLVSTVAARLGCPGSAGDATQLPFPGNTFDIIVSSECIEHTSHPFRAIREMCRICKPNGHICFTTPNRRWYWLLRLSQTLGIRKFAGVENWIYPHHAINVLKNCGMRDLKIYGCHLLPFQLKPLRPILKRIDETFFTLYPLMINFGIVARKPIEEKRI